MTATSLFSHYLWNFPIHIPCYSLYSPTTSTSNRSTSRNLYFLHHVWPIYVTPLPKISSYIMPDKVVLLYTYHDHTKWHWKCFLFPDKNNERKRRCDQFESQSGQKEKRKDTTKLTLGASCVVNCIHSTFSFFFPWVLDFALAKVKFYVPFLRYDK